ncbi:MAG: hypothetical protein N3F07_01680 [Candidatus Micrarchaeota archaeon]|nr:hypothetical protein [Candidatus Micrarchaeota archaeon]
MWADERRIAAASALVALVGIALLFALSESPEKTSVAGAMVSEENSLVEIEGAAENLTSGKFMLCDRVCISVRHQNIPSARLLSQGRQVSVVGRVKEYMGRRYLEAEKLAVR